ncbi:topoisomerase I [Coprinopsis cinerea okayama7|uniref:DNA topoisomerase I n=1 Tax=Coprinopsis cinerea (strain Okayama-7 / 130 / ATCC MYA-4618 / FGSC 9003) TaxID=240176 RepID=A8N6Y9_COPC7|nr:topoisomerase I [Coprinopsis cinerea okayama7\|eukprot:XP_001830595.2 topoisomerase I [Coprinopsis cinerea okayama7\
MSGDSQMLSDDERPLAPNTDANGQPPANGNGGLNGHLSDVSMSDDDDVPLSQTTATRKSEPEGRPSRSLKRKKPVYADSSSSDDDVPLASSPVKAARANGRAKAVKKEEDSDDASAVATSTSSRKRGKGTNGKQPPKKRAVAQSPPESQSSEEEDAPPAKPTRKRKVKAESDSDDAPPAKKPATKSRKRVKKEEEDDEPEAKPSASKANGKVKKEEPASPVKGKGKKGKQKEEEEEEEEEVFKWWEAGDVNGDGTQKWETLEHNGVYFPPPYEALPKHVKMKYNGKDVDLSIEAEEVAGFYGALLETDHAKDATFNKNFFTDFKKVLEKYPPRCGTKITTFELCDFRPMFEYFEAEKAKRKAMTNEEKKAAKKKKDELEEKYKTCVMDGRKEKVGNFRIEPPGLFRGRGEHPKKGSLKKRVYPEDITINIGKEAKIPVPNIPGKWKKVIHDNTVTWLATWTENINNSHKYVFLAAGSRLKGQSDMQKFEKARELKDHIEKIRADYTEDLRNKVMAHRQRATAMYFIDKLALRAGNEKGEDEADTVGCCSLRCEHVTLRPPNEIVFDFLGKDSIRYFKEVPVDAQVFKNIRIFKEGKELEDNLFDRVTTAGLNKHLTSYMKGLTAKVFRTYNASSTFQRLLDEEDLTNATIQEKINAYNKANRMLRSLKYDRMKLRHVLVTQEPKMKKNKKYTQEESDIDDDWIEKHEESLKEKEIEKAEKKFEKENEKLEAEGKDKQKKSVLKERIEAIEEEFERLAQERGTGKATLKRERPTEKLEEMIEKLDDRIKTFKLQMIDRDEGKEVALGTSKINYLDPRITVAWASANKVPIEKMFSKTLLEKFPWAMGVDDDWKF